MEWELEWGSHRERLEALEEDTGETPQALEKRPELKLASHGMIFQRFMTMHMMRTSSDFSPNQITIGMMNENEARFGKMPVDDDLFLRLIKQCDEVALDWYRRKNESKGS